MIDELLSKLAPHHCYSCDKIGSLLCDYCKYNIVDSHELACIVCGARGVTMGVCKAHDTPYSRGWFVGERSGLLEKMVDAYKFENVVAMGDVLAELLSECVGQLPANVIIVPIPTIRSHIRIRGFDHVKKMGRHLAGIQSVPLQELLVRTTQSTQKGASRKQRIEQARSSFGLKGNISPDSVYLLIDDVTTTGATLRYGAQLLRDSGATNVWAAAISRQPLD